MHWVACADACDHSHGAGGFDLVEIDNVRLLQNAEMGSFLGLGTSTVLITPDELESRSDGLQLRMPAEQIRSVLQEQR